MQKRKPHGDSSHNSTLPFQSVTSSVDVTTAPTSTITSVITDLTPDQFSALNETTEPPGVVSTSAIIDHGSTIFESVANESNSQSVTKENTVTVRIANEDTTIETGPTENSTLVFEEIAEPTADVTAMITESTTVAAVEITDLSEDISTMMHE